MSTAIHRPRDDQGSTRFVYQARVDLIHDGIVVPALYAMLGCNRHVVAQVIETELVVRSVGYVGVVDDPSFIGDHVVLDYAHF